MKQIRSLNRQKNNEPRKNVSVVSTHIWWTVWGITGSGIHIFDLRIWVSKNQDKGSGHVHS